MRYIRIRNLPWGPCSPSSPSYTVLLLPLPVSSIHGRSTPCRACCSRRPGCLQYHPFNVRLNALDRLSAPVTLRQSPVDTCLLLLLPAAPVAPVVSLVAFRASCSVHHRHSHQLRHSYQLLPLLLSLLWPYRHRLSAPCIPCAPSAPAGPSAARTTDSIHLVNGCA